ncbi:hypothetical protein ACFPRL_06685 [Pseudoclavibacter helvolus]
MGDGHPDQHGRADGQDQRLLRHPPRACPRHSGDRARHVRPGAHRRRRPRPAGSRPG